MPALVGVDDVEEKSGGYFDYQELKDILFAPVSEVLGFFPVSELVGFLAVPKGPEVMDLFLVLNHDRVDLSILHHVLYSQLSTL